jgi:hypothetical protein
MLTNDMHFWYYSQCKSNTDSLQIIQCAGAEEMTSQFFYEISIANEKTMYSHASFKTILSQNNDVDEAFYEERCLVLSGKALKSPESEGNLKFKIT